MEAGSIHFCKECHNMTYIHLNEEDELIHACKICSTTEKFQETIHCIHSTEYTDFDISSIINSNKYVTHDITLPVIEDNPNLKCPNPECECNTKNSKTSFKYIQYNTSDMKYIYICNTCGQKWNN